MLRYTARRIGEALVTLALIVTIVFLLGRLTGDPTNQLLPIDASSDQRMHLRHALGLDQPLLLQYVTYVRGLLVGDLGISYQSHAAIAPVLLPRLVNSMELALVSVAVSILVAVPLGALAAVRRGGWIDQGLLAFSMLGQAAPPFWLGLVLILTLSVWLQLLPPTGKDSLLSFVMPCFTLGWFMSAGLLRLTRSGMLDVLSADYITFARSKGVSEVRVILLHALRNALIAPVTFAALYAGLLIGATVVVETIFNWPGIGRLAYEAILARDLPVMQDVVLLAAASVLVFNVAGDLLLAAIDPRISYG